MLRTVALAALLSAQGCSLITGDCNSIGYPGVIATVRDARTQLPPASNVTLTLRDGPYVEVRTSPAYGPGEYTLAMSREGVYSLTVEAAGYQTFVQNDLVVRGGSCTKVTTNNVAVQLIPIP
jgi:hypothetical protein